MIMDPLDTVPCVFFFIKIRILQIKIRILTDTDTDMDGQHCKQACDCACALYLYDAFDARAFCLPLLLEERLTTAEAYLERSPRALSGLMKGKGSRDLLF